MQSQYESSPTPQIIYGLAMPEPVQVPIPESVAKDVQPPDLQKLHHVIQRLQDAVRSIIQYEPGMRPQQITRKLGLSKDVASRVVTCCELSNALEFAYSCPSPAALRKVVDAVRESRPGTGAERVERIITEYEEFVQAEFGDQSTMNVLIGAMHPSLGERAEAVQKQSAFRGMSQLHGLFAEVHVNAAVIARGSHPTMRTLVVSEGCLGLRRLRPGPPIVLKSGEIDAKTGQRVALVGEKDVTQNWREALSLEDSVDGTAWVTPTQVSVGNMLQSRIDRDILGTRRAVNFGVTSMIPSQAIGTVKETGNPWAGMGLLVPVPAKVLVYDFLVEEGLYDNSRPKLVIYDTVMRGPSALFEPSREFDRLHLHERVEELDGANGHNSTDVPFMPRLVEYMLNAGGIAGRTYRRYRVRQGYPVYGSQVAMALPRPQG